MSGRRKWDKQSEFHPQSAAASATAAVDASDPVLEKQRQYIRMLEERNRLKKKLVAASKSQREREQLQEREEAFVTTFNVPKAAPTSSAGGASGGTGGIGAASHHHGAGVRKNKSATSLLPTKMAAPSGASSSAASLRPQYEAAERQSQCKSAPSTMLHSRQLSSTGEQASGGESAQRPARAKWSKPQGLMNIAVENRDGKPHLCLSDQARLGVAEEKEQRDAKSIAEDDEKSAERKCGARSQDSESDGEDENDGEGDDDVEESYLEESFEDFDEDDAEEPSECEEIIAVDAKGKFQSSERRESDVKDLRSSIGDPQIWEQLKATLFSGNEKGDEQKRWEEEYAQQVKERLAQERLEKEKALRAAEERRVTMMKQLEEEERELEQLMERKRQERLAKLRALEQEVESVPGLSFSAATPSVTVYDANGDELEVDLASLKLYDESEHQPLPKSHDMVRGLGRLFDGIAHTNSEQNMWLGRISSSGVLQLSFDVPSLPSKLCVWNYNSKLSNACARDIEVLVSGKCVWTGSLPETFGDEDDNAVSKDNASSVATRATPLEDPLESEATPAIPVLPSGTRLKLEILSTWGDPHYVGLNGIELFDQNGNSVSFRQPEQQVRACPASINDLEEYSDDPRVATNLVDGVNFTCDDFHMWLAPFTLGEEHFVELELGGRTSLSMVRVWNYNKSRAHSYRGVRHARLTMYASSAVSATSRPQSAGVVVFEGEICKAHGVVNADCLDQSCEVILFTRDEEILQAIEANDRTLTRFAQSNEEDKESCAIVASVRSSMEMQRPRTSDKGGAGDLERAKQLQESYAQYLGQESNGNKPSVGRDGRPTTAAVRPLAVPKAAESWLSPGGEPQQRSLVLEEVTESCDEVRGDDDYQSDDTVRGRRISIKLLSTWGDANYIGLTQIDVLVGRHGTPFPLDASHIDATPRDLESLIYGLRVWNYNKSSDDTFRGVKQLHVAVDGLLVSPKDCGFVLRKAPGTALFDFGQTVRFDTSTAKSSVAQAYVERIRYPFESRAYKTPIVRQDYEPSLYPQGFLLKFVFWSTWGDPYYLGLNGLELYDFHGKKLQYVPQIIAADPHSIAELSKSVGGAADVRVPENLLSGKNKSTWDASDAWLAPLASSLGSHDGNVVYVTFDAPVVLSMIKFWNYSKTPERGAKELDIYLDDLHLYSGTLRKAPNENHGVGRLGTKVQMTEDFGQPILFSAHQAQVDAEKRRVLYCGAEEQDVLCINEGQVVQESLAMYRKPDPGAEG
ncbi:hypothetical protein PybrP1_003635, partial [[Pythium] brassicae (nom. inval.)]